LSIRLPANVISPASAVMLPVIRLNSVVLPEPFGPINAVIEPSATVRSAPSTAVRPPKRLVTPRTSSSGPDNSEVDRVKARSWACTGEARVSAPLWSVNSVSTGCRLRQAAAAVGSSPAGRNSTTSTRIAPRMSTRVDVPPP